jgi:DNA repair exonuclease SbcCD ATPase subunit
VRVRKIILKNFMSHNYTEFSLPDRGLVVIAGETGAGKSTLIEAVSFAFSGETLRGAPPWRQGMEGFVEVHTDEVKVSRSVTPKGKQSLFWEGFGDSQKNYSTMTKASEALAKRVGIASSVWQKCCVFSSTTAETFALATDAKRKEFVEDMLGADKFNVALKMARSENTAAQSHLLEVENEAAVQEARRDALKASVVTPLQNVQYDPKLHSEAVARHKDLVAQHDEVASGRLEAVRAESTAQAAYKAANKKLAELQKRNCVVCGQEIPVKDRDLLLASATADLAATKSQLEAAAAVTAEFAQAVAAAYADVSAAAQEVSKHTMAATAHAALVNEHARKAGLRQDLALVEARLAEVREQLDAVRYTANMTAFVAEALNTRGVRARMLNGVLGDLTRNTNHWLARLAPGRDLEVDIGTVDDKIQIKVKNAGGGYGYKGSSSGERKLQDLAVLLSLSSMSAAAHGIEAPTLWFDEPFDNLFPDLISSVAGCLVEMSKSQCVVVITHNDALKHVPGSRKLFVRKGVVS